MIKSVPKIIAANQLNVTEREIATFMQDEAQGSLEELHSRVQHELDLLDNLAKRRLAVYAQVKDLHPEIADDVWGSVASQMNVELGDRLS